MSQSKGNYRTIKVNQYSKRKIMMRRKNIIRLSLFISFLLFAGPVLGTDVFIYPTKGQSKQQQDKDQFECYNWAKQQTGFDPMAKPKATTPSPAKEAPEGGVVKGAGRGALLGLAVGAIAGDAGEGAAIGAAAGGLLGGMKRSDQVRSEEQAQQEWAAKQAAEYEKNRANYNRAFGACMEGRGYQVK
jgi:hypothetical protein